MSTEHEIKSASTSSSTFESKSNKTTDPFNLTTDDLIPQQQDEEVLLEDAQLCEEDIQQLLKEIIDSSSSSTTTATTANTTASSHIIVEKEESQSTTHNTTYRDSIKGDDDNDDENSESSELYLPLPLSLQPPENNQEEAIDSLFLKENEKDDDDDDGDLLQTFQSLDIQNDAADKNNNNKQEVKVVEVDQEQNNQQQDPFLSCPVYEFDASEAFANNTDNSDQEDWSSLLQEELTLNWNHEDFNDYRSVFDDDNDEEDEVEVDNRESDEGETKQKLASQSYPSKNQSNLSSIPNQNKNLESIHEEEPFNEVVEEEIEQVVSSSQSSIIYPNNTNTFNNSQQIFLEQAFQNLSVNEEFLSQILEEQLSMNPLVTTTDEHTNTNGNTTANVSNSNSNSNINKSREEEELDKLTIDESLVSQILQGQMIDEPKKTKKQKRTKPIMLPLLMQDNIEGPLVCQPCNDDPIKEEEVEEEEEEFLTESQYSKEEEKLLKRIILNQMMAEEESAAVCVPCGPNSDNGLTFVKKQKIETETLEERGPKTATSSPFANNGVGNADDENNDNGHVLDTDVFDSMAISELQPDQFDYNNGDLGELFSKEEIESLQMMYGGENNSSGGEYFDSTVIENNQVKTTLKPDPQARGKPMALLQQQMKASQNQTMTPSDGQQDVHNSNSSSNQPIEEETSNEDGDNQGTSEQNEQIENNIEAKLENLPPQQTQQQQQQQQQPIQQSKPQDQALQTTCIPCVPCGDDACNPNLRFVKKKEPIPQCHEPGVKDIYKYSEPMIKSFQDKRKNERQCFGHKENIFGLAFSPCGKYCASASQDSTVRIWNVKTNALVKTLNGHDKENECLRVVWASSSWNGMDDYSVLASGGADGLVNVWRTSTKSDKDLSGKWDCLTKLNHNGDKFGDGKPAEDDKPKGENDVAQIYALQFIDDWKGLPPSTRGVIDGMQILASQLPVLMTSSDDFIHLWQITSDSGNKAYFSKVMDIRFTHLEHGYGGVFVHLHGTSSNDDNNISTMKVFEQSSNIVTDTQAYGGDRNPENLIYVFDAQYCQANKLLGVALSDGSLRLVNGRGVCVTILQLPDCNSHLTSFGWDKTGTRIATCVATSHLILWRLHFGQSTDWVTPQCQAVLEGGHTPDRPLFGVKFFGGKYEDLLLSWSIDGTLCLWDSFSQGQVGAPLSVLLSLKDYPIYTVDVVEKDAISSNDRKRSVVALAGGRESGFLGLPLYLYDFELGEDDSDSAK